MSTPTETVTQTTESILARERPKPVRELPIARIAVYTKSDREWERVPGRSIDARNDRFVLTERTNVAIRTGENIRVARQPWTDRNDNRARDTQEKTPDTPPSSRPWKGCDRWPSIRIVGYDDDNDYEITRRSNGMPCQPWARSIVDSIVYHRAS